MLAIDPNQVSVLDIVEAVQTCFHFLAANGP